MEGHGSPLSKDALHEKKYKHRNKKPIKAQEEIHKLILGVDIFWENVVRLKKGPSGLVGICYIQWTADEIVVLKKMVFSLRISTKI